jgi:amidophosphoribosyltransferase
VFGIWGHPQASRLTYYALHSLQHRGQEGTGIVVTDGAHLQGKKGEGLVTDIFTVQSMAELKGTAAIGHVRYTIGGSDAGYENVQPLLFRSSTGSLALCHSGHLLNGLELRRQLEEQGSIFQTSSDAEVVAHLIRRSKLPALKEQVQYALGLLQGAYAFLLLTERELIAALDPKGLRPLSLGRLGEAWVIASESCAFDIIGAQFERDVQPGELIIVNDQGIHSEVLAPASRNLCAMEYVYFARPDCNLGGINVHTARKELGKQLARECPVEADVVTGVPDSSLSAAIGYAEELRIPYEMGLVKSRYIGRTFIEPSPSLREQGVKLKLSAVRGVVEGKRVALVDDSFVRGTTGKRITRLLKEAGAREVHLLISSPPIRYPCFYGIDTLSTEELLAAHYDLAELTALVGADSLHFLSVAGMRKVLGGGLCLACFTGEYPTEVPEKFEEGKRWQMLTAGRE